MVLAGADAGATLHVARRISMMNGCELARMGARELAEKRREERREMKIEGEREGERGKNSRRNEPSRSTATS